ncbi:MAG: hypothetical protein ABI538_03105 [Pseudoxanthomonas sp.]
MLDVAVSNDQCQTRRDRIHPETIHPQGEVHESRIAPCGACGRFVEHSFHRHRCRPGREAAGWKNWADFTETLVANAAENDYNSAGVKTACKGVTGMTISQGLQIPYWGQSLIQACQVYAELGDVNGNIGMASVDNDLLKKIFKRKKKSLCKDSERVAENLGKATPIASEPRAQQLAFDLAESMGRTSTMPATAATRSAPGRCTTKSTRSRLEHGIAAT